MLQQIYYSKGTRSENLALLFRTISCFLRCLQQNTKTDNPYDGGRSLVRNVATHIPDYTTSCNLNIHSRENLLSHAEGSACNPRLLHATSCAVLITELNNSLACRRCQCLDYIPSQGRMDGKHEDILNEAIVAQSRYYPEIRLEGLKKTTSNFSQSKRYKEHESSAKPLDTSVYCLTSWLQRPWIWSASTLGTRIRKTRCRKLTEENSCVGMREFEVRWTQNTVT
jgi:hypothetical protein